MKPYYSDEYVTLYHGDCREVLPNVQADAVVTDPPYGICDRALTQTRHGKRIGSSNTWHPESTWDTHISPEWVTLSADCAPIVAWFGHWRKRAHIEQHMPHPLRCEIVWSKDTHVGFPCPLAMRDERIWVFSASVFKGRTFETTVWDVPIIPTWERKWHKNEKPIALMSRLLRWLPVARIVDPFMGSGTTLVAAKALGIRGVGIELDERHCESAARRLSQGVLDFGGAA